MRLEFTKMHGLGNDFLMLDLVSQRVHLSPALIRKLADRNRGVGFDQLLVVEPPQRPDVDFRYRIYNADGSEVSQCGNGARCFARFVQDRRLTRKDSLTVQTASGIITLHINADGWVRVDMGKPRFTPSEVPFLSDREALTYTLDVDGDQVEFATVSMGNPHAVIRVPDVSNAPVERLGAILESHPSFPERVNVGFMQVLNRSEIRLRVFERGTGETQACGTGACAAAVAAMRQGLVDRQVQVHLPGGTLAIEWSNDEAPVIMTGPTQRSFDGLLRLNDFNESEHER
ncbi:MAG: diaminopimelate epimerase [Acinetobacter sp.]|nr:diaminopimelate epimerase [Acinetobacter sp.]